MLCLFVNLPLDLRFSHGLQTPEAEKKSAKKTSRFLYNKQTCRWVRAGNLALLKMWSVEQSVCSAHVAKLKKLKNSLSRVFNIMRWRLTRPRKT